MDSEKVISPSGRYVVLVTNSKWDGYEPRLVTIRSEYENSERGAVQQFLRDDRRACLGVGGIAIPYEQYQDVKPVEKTFCHERIQND